MNKLKLNHILTLVAIVLVLAGAYLGNNIWTISRFAC